MFVPIPNKKVKLLSHVFLRNLLYLILILQGAKRDSSMFLDIFVIQYGIGWYK